LLFAKKIQQKCNFEDEGKYIEMLKMTIEVNKKLLPSIQKHKLDREIQMRIMKRVGELKNELKEIEEGGAGQQEGEGDTATDE